MTTEADPAIAGEALLRPVRPGNAFEEIDDALRLREILEVGAARMAAARTLTAAERKCYGHG
jgi:DNA-binding FadR family transcriptional regulator